MSVESKQFTFKDALEDYMDNPSDKRYICSEGMISFYTGKDLQEDGVAIYNIHIKEELQKKGIFTNFINHIIDTTNYRKVSILAMSTEAIINFAKRFEHSNIGFIDHGGDALWARDGDYCRCCIWEGGKRVGSKGESHLEV